MKRTLLFAKIFILVCFVLFTIGLFMELLCFKTQLASNAQKWLQDNTSLNVTQFTIVDTREYDNYYIILGSYNSNESACLLSYSKTPVLPLYTRQVITVAENNNLTGIGFDLDKNQHIELLIEPPYSEILVRGSDGHLYQAPQ